MTFLTMARDTRRRSPRPWRVLFHSGRSGIDNCYASARLCGVLSNSAAISVLLYSFSESRYPGLFKFVGSQQKMLELLESGKLLSALVSTKRGDPLTHLAAKQWSQLASKHASQKGGSRARDFGGPPYVSLTGERQCNFTHRPDVKWEGQKTRPQPTRYLHFFLNGAQVDAGFKQVRRTQVRCARQRITVTPKR
jgi:hypothetical protein